MMKGKLFATFVIFVVLLVSVVPAVSRHRPSTIRVSLTWL